MAEAPTKAVLVQHSETSTGVIHDVEAIGRITRPAGVLLVVDAISSLGAVPYDGDGWGIDVGSAARRRRFGHAGAGLREHLAEAAWEATEAAQNPRFYFDWKLYQQSYGAKTRRTRSRPAISLMLGMRAALRRYFSEGPEAVLARHRELSHAVKEGIGPSAWTSPASTSSAPGQSPRSGRPRGSTATRWSPRSARDHRIILAPGQGPMKGKDLPHRPPRATTTGSTSSGASPRSS